MLKRPAFEAPTFMVALIVHAAWLWLTWYGARLPAWALMGLAPLGGFVVAWHGSLQHEITHGHPTRWRGINTAIGSLPIGLLLPFGIYREQHLVHHRSPALTDPLFDPESFYVTRSWWGQAQWAERALARARMTVVGRLLLGPPSIALRFLASELSALARGDFSHARVWAVHLIGVSVVVAWLEFVGMSVSRYLFCFAYPGMALTLLRSFAEHRPAAEVAHRSVIVESGGLASLLYLNNNLHVVHHDEPALPWYELPARYAARRGEVLASNGGYVLPGYGWLLARYGLRAKDSPIHPHA
jgi:fatty acid desaturase